MIYAYLTMVILTQSKWYHLQEQLYIVMLEEYGANEENAIRKLYNFFGFGFNKRRFQSKRKVFTKVVNKGYKRNPVLDKTIDMLDEFYKPFNIELAKYLGNDKWLFRR